MIVLDNQLELQILISKVAECEAICINAEESFIRQAQPH